MADQIATVRAVALRGTGGGGGFASDDGGAAAAHVSDDARPDDDEGEWNLEEENRNECGPGNGPVQRTLQSLPRHAQKGFDHDCEHGCLDAQEDRFEGGSRTELGVGQRQRQHYQRTGKYEQEPRNQPAPDAVKPPANVGRQLHRLRAGQEHAEVEAAQKSPIVDPALLIDQNAMHEGDLSGRSAERQQTDLRPRSRRFG